MKKIGEKKVTARNGLGGYSTSVHTQFEVEPQDVGKVRDNHRGYKHESYQLKASDVGRIITVYTDDTNWTCWSF